MRFAKLVHNGSDFCTLRQRHERLGLALGIPRHLFGQLILATLWQRSASTLLYYPHCKLLFAQEEVVQLCHILGSFKDPVRNLPKKKGLWTGPGVRAEIVSWSQCWHRSVVDWDWPQIQTALTYFNSFVSLNCIWRKRREGLSAKGISHFIKENCLSWFTLKALGILYERNIKHKWI